MREPMRPDAAFDSFQKVVYAKASHVREARRRRDVFRSAFNTLDDVTEVIPSGSLARGTQLDPIHYVDLIVVFDAAAHRDWGDERGSAEAALEYTGGMVTQLLGATDGSIREYVRHTELRNHVVKCFLESRWEVEHESFRRAFAVEVMPAFRIQSRLRVPERRNDRW